ncbi:hypothetical protein SFRURICE_001475 [Spodoptera frugiperda]|nr:hypothetical protein SFRURICE_001475 [Spodoptera frugiperda]
MNFWKTEKSLVILCPTRELNPRPLVRQSHLQPLDQRDSLFDFDFLLCEEDAELEYAMFLLSKHRILEPIYGKPSIAHIYTNSVSTSAKLCVPMNIIGGGQTHLKHNIADLWWKSSLTQARSHVIGGEPIAIYRVFYHDYIYKIL